MQQPPPSPSTSQRRCPGQSSGSQSLRVGPVEGHVEAAAQAESNGVRCRVCALIKPLRRSPPRQRCTATGSGPTRARTLPLQSANRTPNGCAPRAVPPPRSASSVHGPERTGKCGALGCRVQRRKLPQRAQMGPACFCKSGPALKGHVQAVPAWWLRRPHLQAARTLQVGVASRTACAGSP